MKNILFLLILLFAGLNGKTQLDCVYKGIIYLKPNKQRLIVKMYNFEDSLEIKAGKYYDCCFDTVYKINLEHPIDTADFNFFSALSFTDKIKKIKFAVSTFYTLCKQNEAHTDSILNEKQSNYLESYYNPMLSEFTELWDQKLVYKGRTNATLLHQIFQIRDLNALSADVHTMFSLSKMFVANPKEFIRQLLVHNTKRQIRASSMEEDIETYVAYINQYRKNKDALVQKYVTLFQQLTK